MKTIIKFLIIGLIALSTMPLIAGDDLRTGTSDPEAGSASYIVSFDARGIFRPRVSAEIHLAGEELIMEPFYTDFLPDGWATYVLDLTVSDAEGRSIPFTRNKSVWTLEEPFTSPLRLEYSVDYSFARKPWPYGNHTAASLTENALFSTARILLIHANDTEAATIEFRHSREMNVSAPWDHDPMAPGRYIIDSRMELLRNFFVVGSFREYREKFGKCEFTFIPINAAADYTETVFALTSGLMRYFLDLMRDSRETRFHFVLFEGSGEGGEAYNDGFAMVTAMHPRRDSVLLWGNTVAHEILHRWNGVFPDTTVEKYYDLQWFMEGFTEYLATLSLLRTGRIDEAAWLDKLEKGIEAYLLFKRGAPYERVSLQEAGKNKQETNPALYHGGAAAALCLDIIIREQSGNELGLEDFIGEMAERFFNRRTQYSVAQLRQTLAKYAGETGEKFLDDYVLGKKTIPLSDYLSRAGIELMVNDYFAYIKKAKACERGAADIRKSILHSSTNKDE
jgi:hypothetical protein